MADEELELTLQVAFKGIFAQGLADLYLANNDENIYNYLNTQLLSNAFRNLDSSWLYGEIWNGPWNVTTAGPKTQLCVIALMGAAARVNVHRNSLVQQTTNASIATQTVYFSQASVPIPTGASAASTGGNMVYLGAATGRVTMSFLLVILAVLLALGH